MQLSNEDSDGRMPAEAMNPEVLATVSHELRSPLTSIKGYTATLLRLERRISRQERQEYLLAIHQASERLQAIIDRFLEVSELEIGSINWRRTEIDVNRIAQEAMLKVQECTNESLPGRFTFHLHLKDEQGIPTLQEHLVLADPRLFREVMDNLLDNAINYSPEGGRIDIVIQPVQGRSAGRQVGASTAAPESGQRNALLADSEAQAMLDICVCDHGQGIPSGHLERVFERFHRGDTGLTRTVNGLGLGLTICKCIVEMHGGTIWAESCPAGGSAFHVQLPLTEEGDTH